VIVSPANKNIAGADRRAAEATTVMSKTRMSAPANTATLVTRLVALAVLLLACTHQAFALDTTGWRMVSDKNGIQVYMKHDDEARIKTFRGVTRFRVQNLHAMSGVLNDTPNMPRWMHFISKAKEIRRSDYLNREYQFLTTLPWPLADREAVVKLLVRQDAATQGVTVHVINAPTLLPPNSDYIRFPQMTGIFAFIPTGRDKEVEVTYELVLDPGGYIPAWIANIVLKDTPYFTLERLRRVVERPEYQTWKDPVLQLPW